MSKTKTVKAKRKVGGPWHRMSNEAEKMILAKQKEHKLAYFSQALDIVLGIKDISDFDADVKQ
jgi:hypothetical protein